jgi:hypothetical protein
VVFPLDTLTNKYMTEADENQVSLNRKKFTNLKAFYSQLIFAVFENPLARPVSKSRSQQYHHWGLLGGIC